jgi:hypothetical protein
MIHWAGGARSQADVEQLRTMLLQVCYYIDNYPSRRPMGEPASRALSRPSYPSPSLRTLPVGA